MPVIKTTIQRFNVTWWQECLRSMAFLHSLPALHCLKINDSNVAEKWGKWREIWEHYSIASKVNKEEGDVQVAVLLTDLKQGKSSKLGFYRLPRGKILKVSLSVLTTTAIRERIFPSSAIFLICGSKSLGIV